MVRYPHREANSLDSFAEWALNRVEMTIERGQVGRTENHEFSNQDRHGSRQSARPGVFLVLALRGATVRARWARALRFPGLPKSSSLALIGKE